MLLDRSHQRWFWFTIAATVFLIASYAIYAHPAAQTTGGPNGGSLPGLAYGIAAFLIMIFASLLGARKKLPAVRIGRATTWMKGHLWLSLLLIPLVFFHSGFRWGSPLTIWIWILFGTVMASGLLGAALQHFLPRLMTEQVKMETVYDQIDHVINQLRYETDVQMIQLTGSLEIDLVVPEGVTAAKIKESPPQSGSDILQKLYLERVRPSLDPKSKPDVIFRTPERLGTFFDQAKLSLSPVFHPALVTLKNVMEERRQLARQKVLHHWLHGWLFCHVPISAALMILVIAHIISALWY